MSSWPEPGTTTDDNPPGTPVGSDDAVSSNHVGRPPQPGETAGRPFAPDAEAVDPEAAAEAAATREASQPPER
jgi:hypothetical protein